MSKRRTRSTGQFVPRPIEMLRSPAFARVEPDRPSHPGAHRDRTRQTRRKGQRASCRSRTPTFASTASTTTPSALGFREVVALGFVEQTQRGFAGPTEHCPSLFRLTYLPANRARPTDEWRNIGTIEEAEAIAQKARASKPRRESSFNQRRKKFRVIASAIS